MRTLTQIKGQLLLNDLLKTNVFSVARSDKSFAEWDTKYTECNASVSGRGIREYLPLPSSHYSGQ